MLGTSWLLLCKSVSQLASKLSTFYGSNTMGSLYKPRDIQSPCITRTEAKPVTEVETETPHTKESETIILIKAVI